MEHGRNTDPALLGAGLPTSPLLGAWSGDHAPSAKRRWGKRKWIKRAPRSLSSFPPFSFPSHVPLCFCPRFSVKDRQKHAHKMYFYSPSYFPSTQILSSPW